MGNWIKDSCNWTFSDQNNPKIKKHSPQISVRDIVFKKRKKTNELEIKSGMFFSQQLTQIKEKCDISILHSTCITAHCADKKFGYIFTNILRGFYHQLYINCQSGKDNVESVPTDQ